MSLATGNDVVAERGGRWVAASWGTASRTFLAASDNVLRRELELWRVDNRPPWNRMRFVLVGDKTADAFAHYAYGWHTIGVHAGLAHQLWHALPRIVSSKYWKRRIGKIDPPLFAGDTKTMGEIVARSALRWVFAHEIAHAFRGHTLFLRDRGLRPTLNEASGATTKVDWKIRRFFELDADATASDLLVALDESVVTPESRESGLAQVIFAVGLVLLLLDRGETDLRHYENEDHPHPFVRLQFALDISGGRASRELELPKDRIEHCAQAALAGLGLAAKALGYSAPTWTLSAREYRRALEFMQQDTDLWHEMTKALMGQWSSLGHARWFAYHKGSQKLGTRDA